MTRQISKDKVEGFALSDNQDLFKNHGINRVMAGIGK